MSDARTSAPERLRRRIVQRDSKGDGSFASVVSRIAHDSVRASPPIMPDGRWWRNLESNFYRRPEGFDLAMRDRWRVLATAAADIGIRTAGATAVGALAVPFGYHPLRLRNSFKHKDFYSDFVTRGDRDAFFKKPAHGVEIRRRRVKVHPLGDSGTVEDLSFKSPFEPLHPAQRARWQRRSHNRIARARYLRHDGPPRPTVAFIHGFFADPYWLNELVFALPEFYWAGCNVLLFTLPFHGKRQSRLSPFSGHGFFSGGVTALNEAFAQTVFDFRILLDFLLNSERAPEVGVTGISLGGYSSALIAAVEDRLAFSVPNVPVASLPDLVLEWEPLGTLMKTAMVAAGVSIKDLRQMTAVHSPLTWTPRLPRDRLMVIGGVGDRLAPPKHTRLLWDHWERCRIHWFPGSHVIHLDQGEYIGEMMHFMRDIDFLP